MREKQVAMMRARGYLPVREVAVWAGLSLPSIYRLLDEGKLAGTSVGRARYVSIASVKELFGEAIVPRRSRPAEGDGKP